MAPGTVAEATASDPAGESSGPVAEGCAVGAAPLAPLVGGAVGPEPDPLPADDFVGVAPGPAATTVAVACVVADAVPGLSSATVTASG